MPERSHFFFALVVASGSCIPCAQPAPGSEDTNNKEGRILSRTGRRAVGRDKVERGWDNWGGQSLPGTKRRDKDSGRRDKAAGQSGGTKLTTKRTRLNVAISWAWSETLCYAALRRNKHFAPRPPHGFVPSRGFSVAPGPVLVAFYAFVSHFCTSTPPPVDHRPSVVPTPLR